MANDVFISYSSTDKAAADAVCATLESRGIGCWIAPRNILPGEAYAAALVRALNDSRLMILVFSRRADQSPQVLREVERAVSKGLTIVPLRIDDAAPTSAMEYYISSCQWLDAATGPLTQHLESLTETVKQLLSRTGDARPAGPSTTVAPQAQRKRSPWPRLAAVAGGLVVAVSLLLYFVANRAPTRAASPPVQAVQAVPSQSGTPSPQASESAPISTPPMPPASSSETASVKAGTPKSALTPAGRPSDCARLLERVSLGEEDLLTAAEKARLRQCGR